MSERLLYNGSETFMCDNLSAWDTYRKQMIAERSTMLTTMNCGIMSTDIRGSIPISYPVLVIASYHGEWHSQYNFIYPEQIVSLLAGRHPTEEVTDNTVAEPESIESIEDRVI